MKTLVLVFHPDIEESKVNKRWCEELAKYPDEFTLRDVYRTYPDHKIDIKAEQELAEAHDRIVFQFPFYWFNCPPLFKQWLDEVLEHGWAYGRGSNYKLSDKTLAMAISAGINESDYHAEGRYKYTLEQLTAPFEITFQYIRSNYRPLFAFYGAEHNGTQERIDESAKQYIEYLRNL